MENTHLIYVEVLVIHFGFLKGYGKTTGVVYSSVFLNLWT